MSGISNSMVAAFDSLPFDVHHVCKEIRSPIQDKCDDLAVNVYSVVLIAQIALLIFTALGIGFFTFFCGKRSVERYKERCVARENYRGIQDYQNRKRRICSLKNVNKFCIASLGLVSMISISTLLGFVTFNLNTKNCGKIADASISMCDTLLKKLIEAIEGNSSELGVLAIKFIAKIAESDSETKTKFSSLVLSALGQLNNGTLAIDSNA